jgi:hypothetical protein
MSITRSQIARQMYADGALVDPRMANTLEQNKAINNANAQINQAMRSSGGLKSLYDQYGISDADRSRLSGGMASRNMILQNSHREELVKQLAGLQNQNVVYSSYRPPKPPTDMFGILISDHNKYGVGSDPTKVSETDMNAFRQRVLDAQKNYYQKELDLINQDYISSGYPDQARTLEEYMRSIGAYAKGGRAGYAYGGRGYSDYASPSSTTAQIATQLLNEMAPKGEKLAYINNREAELLKRMGGAGKNINETGIKSYYYDEVGQTMGGTGFQDTSSLTGGSGDGGGGSYDYIPQPTVAQLQKALQPTTVPDTTVKYFPDYGIVESIARKAATIGGKGIGFLAAPYGLGFVINNLINKEQEKEEKAKADLTNAALTGSFFVPSEGRLPKDLITQSDITLGFNPRTTQGPPTPDYTGGDNQPIRLPIIAEAPSDVESTSSDFDLYAALEGREGMRFGENPYDIRGVTQRFAGGGEVRQAYGLGKLVKKATRAVKKVLKSDIGKAALIAAGTYALGGGGNPFTAAGRGKFDFMNIPGYSKAKNFIGNNSMMKDINKLPGYVKYGIPAASLASYFASEQANEDENTLDDEIAQKYKDTSGLKEQLATYKPFRFEVQKKYQLPSYAADGGRIGYGIGDLVRSSKIVQPVSGGDTSGGGFGEMGLMRKLIQQNPEMFRPASNQQNPEMFRPASNEQNPEMFRPASNEQRLLNASSLNRDFIDLNENGIDDREEAAYGERTGYEIGGDIDPADLPMSREGLPTYEDIETGEEVEYPYENKERSSAPDIDAELFQMYLDAIGSGKIPRSTTFDQYKELMGEKASMSPERTMANEGGLMNLGGNEMDLRGGGFVPLGAKEKADDVPARLSKNEFVFTADAVRAAGGGDVDTGADLMYKTMKNLESRVG